MEIPSMKLNHKKEEAISGKPILSLGEDREAYPYGLCLRLDNETLEMLNFKELPKVGERFHLKGFAEVKSVSLNKSEKGEESKNVELQITNLMMHTIEDGNKIEQTMYGEAPKAKMLG